ncbi:hypothetical protein F4860DRAFT_510195 [Xylaria cubensis]|nr:hypothetical protein F4860DRAFT_510195 [Xylaria cubensis]
MSFRTIQPYPSPRQADDDDSDRIPIKNRHLRVCDGSRPRCLVCVSRHRDCVFRGGEGQSREGILKSRIESLEQRLRELEVDQMTPTDSAESSTASPIPRQAHDSIGLTMPSIQVTKRALDGFFSCSGKLFHVFSQAQVACIADLVYSEANDESESRKADIGSLMAVAAVGSQYNNTAIEDEVQEIFYNVAKLHFDAVITQRPLDAIKICALLCMYNVFSKATVSLAYVDVGLGICDRYGLHCQQRQLNEITDSMWLDYRKAWRTLIFLSTWLSATLGYKTGNYKVIQQVSTFQLQIENQGNISEVVQTEMTKIAFIQAKILHMNLAFKYLAIEPLNSMIQDLQDWYHKLPPQMQLQSLSEQDIPVEARRSTYHVHLLYLGAHMLLFRRIVAEHVQTRQPDTNVSPLWHPSSDLLSRQGPNALLAANSSARVVKLLLDEKGVFQRCWLIIFQSYTSCIIIMHAILTKLVSSSTPSTYRDEMENARLCLEALAWCGAADQVASHFHEKAKAIYDSVQEHIQEHNNSHPTSDDTEYPSPPNSSTAEQGSREPSGTLPAHLKELSFDLLVMLCRPFGDPSYREGSKESLAATHRLDPSRYEHPVMVERLAWDFEDSVTFQWSPDVLGLGSAGSRMSGAQITPTESRFLDSRHPSGWS